MSNFETKPQVPKEEKIVKIKDDLLRVPGRFRDAQPIAISGGGGGGGGGPVTDNDTNIYNTDGTLSGNRLVDLNANSLTFSGGDYEFQGGDVTVEDISGNDGTFNTVSGANIFGGDVSANDITGNTVSGASVEGSTITGGSVTGGTVSGNSVSGDNITGNTISGSDITGTNIVVEDTISGGDAIFDTVVTSSTCDLDEDTCIFLEKEPDEDRIRFEVGSTFHAVGRKFLGHMDDEGVEFRSFLTDNQPIDSNDDVENSSLSRRAEIRLYRGDFHDMPSSAVAPNLDTSGVVALHRAGRDTRMIQTGAVIGDNNFIHAGNFCEGATQEGFMGSICNGSLTHWIRTLNTSNSDESYIRVEPARLIINLNETGQGPATQGMLARDDAHFSNGGAVWRPPFTDEYGRASNGVTSNAQQIFDNTVRGVTFGTLVTNAGGIGATNSDLGIGQTTSSGATSSGSTPAGSNYVGGTNCTAFDLGAVPGSTAGLNASPQHFNCYVELAFESLSGTLSNESIYQVTLHENGFDQIVNDNKKYISFGPDRTVQSLSFFTHLPGRGTTGSGGLGFKQFEVRVQRIKGTDDIRTFAESASITFVRMS